MSRTNGWIERKHRTLGKSMRCALLDSKIGWRFWFDAQKYACDTRNAVESKIDGKSPYERFYDLKPNYREMVPFGRKKGWHWGRLMHK